MPVSFIIISGSVASEPRPFTERELNPGLDGASLATLDHAVVQLTCNMGTNSRKNWIQSSDKTQLHSPPKAKRPMYIRVSANSHR